MASKTRHTTSRRRQYERDYPHKVDVPQPPGGFGQRLNVMVEWCITNVGRVTDDSPWHSFGARFYFKREADAEAFRRQFCS